jgi:hypothetical protein
VYRHVYFHDDNTVSATLSVDAGLGVKSANEMLHLLDTRIWAILVWGKEPTSRDADLTHAMTNITKRRRNITIYTHLFTNIQIETHGVHLDCSTSRCVLIKNHALYPTPRARSNSVQFASNFQPRERELRPARRI